SSARAVAPATGSTRGRPSRPRPATASSGRSRSVTTSASNTNPSAPPGERPPDPRHSLRFTVPLRRGQNRHRDDRDSAAPMTRVTSVEALFGGPPAQLVRRTATARIPTPYGDFVAHVYESLPDRTEHVALVRGDLGNDPAGGEPH